MPVKSLLTAVIFIFFIESISFAQVVINEIQAAPAKNEPEWIELYNPNDTSVHLPAPYIHDGTSVKRMPDLTISARAYAIVTNDTIELKARRKILSSAVLIQCILPGLNNTTDKIVLRKSDSTVIDSVYYDMKWGKKDFSLERRDWEQPAVSSANLASSISPDNCTPGYINSVSIQDYDLRPEIATDSANITIYIINCGRKDLADFYFNIYLNKGGDNNSLTDAFIIKTESISFLKKSDTLSFNYSKNKLITESYTHGPSRLSVVAFDNKDQMKRNDTARINLYISYPSGSIAINEFMFDVSREHAEYIELYNSTEDTININNWFLHDRAGKSGYTSIKITDSSACILPKSYFIAAWDSSIYDNFPYLNNLNNIFVKKSSLNLNTSSDDIVLIDPNGRKIDSLTYLSGWHIKGLSDTKNISLEKTSPELPSENSLSWSSCLLPEGGTPGKENSYKDNINDSGIIQAEPNPFSPFSNGSDRFCSIKYDFPFQNVQVSMNIYNTSGVLVRELVKSETGSAKGTIIWDGKTENGFSLAVGPYILLVEVIEISMKKNYKYKKMLVIGK